MLINPNSEIIKISGNELRKKQGLIDEINRALKYFD
jgi:hypothetical protein